MEDWKFILTGICAAAPGAVALIIRLRKLSREGQDGVIAHLYEVIDERKKAHKRDVDRLDAKLGMVVAEQEADRKGRERCEIVNARMIEFMRSRNLISESQVYELNRPNEEWETMRITDSRKEEQNGDA